jgi:septal ring factor EnvC (AmiA/AmiB activator)
MNTSLIDCIGLIVLPIISYMLIRISSVQDELEALKLNVAENYAKKNDLATALNKIETSIQRIFEKIDILTERRLHDRHEG